jgi:hypothetical protein
MAVRNPERFFDNRTVKRHIRRGHVSQAEYDTFVNALPDVTDKIRPRDEVDDEDDYDDDEDDDEGPTAPSPVRPAEASGPSPFDDDLDDD